MEMVEVIGIEIRLKANEKLAKKILDHYNVLEMNTIEQHMDDKKIEDVVKKVKKILEQFDLKEIQDKQRIYPNDGKKKDQNNQEE